MKHTMLKGITGASEMKNKQEKASYFSDPLGFELLLFFSCAM